MNTYLSLHERLNLFPTPRVYNTILENRYSTEVKDVNNSNIISPEPILLLDNMLLSSLRSTPVRKLFKYYLGLRKDNKLVIKNLPIRFTLPVLTAFFLGHYPHTLHGIKYCKDTPREIRKYILWV